MSQTRFLLPACFLIAVLTGSSASASPIKVIGLDDTSCRLWTGSKNEPDERKYFVTWVAGVLTGHNYANQRQQISTISNATIEKFVDRYCTENPQSSFSEAAMRMSDRFSGRNEAIKK